MIHKNIEKKLREQFSPEYMDILNESSMHNVPANSETHFRVTLVSNEFDGIILLERHRMVNSVLKDESEQGIHALSIHAFTLAEWKKKGEKVASSPECLGGSKNQH